MFGFEFDGFEAVGVSPVTRPAETEALLVRMSANPPEPRKQAMDGLIGALSMGAVSGSNIWAKLDVLQIHAAPTSADSWLNWKAPSFPAVIGGGSPVFVADRGWFVNGIGDFLDLGCAPSGLGQFSQNNACFGAWMRTPAGVGRANSILGTLTAGTCTLNPRAASNAIGVRINGTTANTSKASTDFYGLTTAYRPGASQIQSGRNGSRGALAASVSAARSPVNFGFGKCNNVFAEGQISAFFAGASLTDAEEVDLHDALSAYIAVVGVTALMPTTRTLSLGARVKLPDGSAAPTAAKGMPCTGVAQRADGKWYVGNGLASAQPLCFSRLSADFATVEREFTVSSLGLGTPPGNGSLQGLCIDSGNPDLMWVVLKIGNGNTTTYLFSFDMAGETLVQAPVALPTLSCNGVADDGVAGTLLITQDISTAVGGMIRVRKADGGNTNSIALLMPGDTDMLHYVAEASGETYQAGDLLVTSGPNVPGGNGTVSVMRRDDYGAYCTRRTETLIGADAIEGIVLSGGSYYVINDAATHPGTPPENMVLNYAA